MAWAVSEDAASIIGAKELDKGAAAGLASEAVSGNEYVGHIPVATEVAAEVHVTSAWGHVI
jgi:hypothetical protein